MILFNITTIVELILCIIFGVVYSTKGLEEDNDIIKLLETILGIFMIIGAIFLFVITIICNI